MHHPAPRPVAADAVEALLAPARDGRLVAPTASGTAGSSSPRSPARRRARLDRGVAGHGSLDAVAPDAAPGSRPLDLVDYTAAWREDLATWGDLLAGLPLTDLPRALDLLRLEGVGDVAGAPGRARVTGRGPAGSRAPSRR